MTGKSAGLRVREWTRRPGQPIPYRPHERLADWWCAGRDARRGLPDLLVPAGADPAGSSGLEPGVGTVPDLDTAQDMWATPRTALLGQLGRGRTEKERIRYQAEVTDGLILLAQARAKRDEAHGELRQAEGRLADLAEPGREDLAARASGEERTDASVLAGRRKREFGQRRQAAEAEVNRIRAAAAVHDLEIARHRETIRISFEVAKTRAAMIDAHVRRRYAAYLTRLARKHPDGQRIGPLIRSGWPGQPPWTARELPPELAGLGAAGRGDPAMTPAGDA